MAEGGGNNAGSRQVSPLFCPVTVPRWGLVVMRRREPDGS